MGLQKTYLTATNCSTGCVPAYNSNNNIIIMRTFIPCKRYLNGGRRTDHCNKYYLHYALPTTLLLCHAAHRELTGFDYFSFYSAQ